MSLLEQCQRLSAPLTEEERQALPVLQRFCASVLLSGVELPPLPELSPLEFAALVGAARTLRKEQALDAGLASQGPYGAAEVEDSLNQDQVASDELAAVEGVAILRQVMSRAR